MRIAAQRGFFQANSAHHPGRGFMQFGLGPAVAVGVTGVDFQRFGDDFFYPHARVERGKRVLKDDLHVAAQAAQSGRRRRQNILAVEAD